MQKDYTVTTDPLSLTDEQLLANGLTADQIKARREFDLDSAMAKLPGDGYWMRNKGSVGTRLREYLKADISDKLLREFAQDVLGAKRLNEGYLFALRIVLGNQAHAEQNNYILEMNTRTSFSTEHTMRNIIGQMNKAGILTKEPKFLGDGRWAAISAYIPPGIEKEHLDMLREDDCTAPSVWEEICRVYDGEMEYWADLPPDLLDEDIPY